MGLECVAKAYGPKVLPIWVNSCNIGIDGEGRCRKGSQKGQSEDSISSQVSELVRIHPLVGALILEAHSLHQLIRLCGPAAGRQRGDMSELCPW